MLSPANYTKILPALMLLLVCACNQRPQRFITAPALDTLSSRHTIMNEKKLQQLTQFGVDQKSGISLDFFFTTNDSAKAQSLSDELSALQYHMNTVHASSGNVHLFVASGSSSRMVMNLQSVNAWTDSMCHAGYRHDCSFSGWNPVTE